MMFKKGVKSLSSAYFCRITFWLRMLLLSPLSSSSRDSRQYSAVILLTYFTAALNFLLYIVNPSSRYSFDWRCFWIDFKSIELIIFVWMFDMCSISLKMIRASLLSTDSWAASFWLCSIIYVVSPIYISDTKFMLCFFLKDNRKSKNPFKKNRFL